MSAGRPRTKQAQKPAGDARSALARATAALAAGDRAAALGHALAAWRARRDPALADAIEELARTVPAPSPLPVKGGKAQDDAFAERAERHAPVDFAALAATPLPRSIDGIEKRLRALAARPPDPRLSTLLFELMASPPNGQTAWWKLAFGLVAEAGDPRSIARLDELATRLEKVARGSVVAYAARRLAEAAAELRAAYPVVPVADADDLAHFTAAVGALVSATRAAGRSGEALLAEIYARPEDDRARAVYGDYLQERGDPRGELIALQLAAAAADPARSSPLDDSGARRVRALLATHTKTWLGALAPVISVARSRFTRGFLSTAVVYARTGPQLDAAVGAPEWATVETLRFTSHGERAACGDIVLHPAMRALRAVHGLGLGSAAAIAKACPVLRIARLGLNCFGGIPDELLRCDGLPELEHIVIAQPPWMTGLADFEELLAAPVASRLRSIAIESGDATHTLVRSTRGAFDLLRVEPGTLDQEPLRWARAYIDDFITAVPGIAEIEIAVDESPAEAELARLLGPVAQLPHRVVAPERKDPSR